jgi:hypothetical protein
MCRRPASIRVRTAAQASAPKAGSKTAPRSGISRRVDRPDRPGFQCRAGGLTDRLPMGNWGGLSPSCDEDMSLATSAAAAPAAQLCREGLRRRDRYALQPASRDDYGTMRRTRGRASFMPAATEPDDPALGRKRKIAPPYVAGLAARAGEGAGATPEGWVTRILAAADMASKATTIRRVRALAVPVRGLRIEHWKFGQAAADTRDTSLTWISARNGPDRL